jgi:hypothetical protein
MKKALFLLFATLALPAAAELRLTDDAGRTVVLAAPAQRIVSLAPHVTELERPSTATTRRRRRRFRASAATPRWTWKRWWR